MSTTTTTTTRATRTTNAQLRRSAGSQSLDKLRDAIPGWTAAEIDRLASEDGKNPVHMAAWQGSIDNLRYLVEDMGCSVNTIATGEYCYGKTPIFFALTRSRNDVVQYLLQQNAHVKIVNNKGQSVLSIASSHLTPALVEEIQQAEQAQSSTPWQNYRATHSDGLEYGDLDPRFLDRPLRQETDVVTRWAINPTTKESRKGSFLKRNPHKKGPGNKSTVQPKRKPRQLPPDLSPEDEALLEQTWVQILNGLSGRDALDELQTRDFQTMIRLSEKRRRAWILEATTRLLTCSVDEALLQKKLLSLDLPGREGVLLEKIALQVSPDESRQRSRKYQPKKRAPAARRSPKLLLSEERLNEGFQEVKHLSMSVFENGGPFLSLPESPRWVDSLEDLAALECASRPEKVVAIDSEWYDNERGHPHTATLQIAFAGCIRPWILDLLEPAIQTQARAVIREIFEKIVVGFAVGHDLPKLEEWMKSSLPREDCLDLQLLFASDRSHVAGLAACAARYSQLGLDKKQQCSEWKRRPLSTAQLEYAGLDASVLLAIYAERHREIIANHELS